MEQRKNRSGIPMTEEELKQWQDCKAGCRIYFEADYKRGRRMTKEELKLEAIKYLENFNDCANCRNRWGDCADQLDEYCLINGCCFATPKEQDIYLAGAEPREKRIAELEEKNRELGDRLCNVANNLLNNWCRDEEDYCPHLAKLEKENAELKKDNSEWEKASDKWKSVYELTNNQLTKAKEIIREFMKYEINEYDGSLEIHFEELKKQAEQFL